jgi:type IV pilus assembly PilX-like protein
MHSFSSNKGSALAISLVILTAITLISISALQRSGIQGRMVGNIQHQEQGFHAANGELEEIYQFYATQTSATIALANPMNNFDMINGEPVYLEVTPGHTSTYNNYTGYGSSESGQKPRLDVTSNITHSGERNSLVEGFTVGTFVEYGFTIDAQAAEPSFGVGVGRTLSSQLVGIKFIAPAS